MQQPKLVSAVSDVSGKNAARHVARREGMPVVTAAAPLLDACTAPETQSDVHTLDTAAVAVVRTVGTVGTVGTAVGASGTGMAAAGTADT